MEVLLTNIRENNNLRQSLIELRALIKDNDNKVKLANTEGIRTILEEKLDDKDAKSRKNAALILGDVFADESKLALWNAFLREETLFVKEAYLLAIANASDISDIEEEMRLQYMSLASLEDEDNKKHISAQLKAFERILGAGNKSHDFIGYDKRLDLIFTVDVALRSMLERQIKSIDRECLLKNHPFGIAVQTEHLSSLLKIRTFRDVFFMLRTKEALEDNAESIARGLINSNLIRVLTSCLDSKGDDDQFRFRIDCKNDLTGSDKSKFIKKIAERIEADTSRRLINSADNYEIEIRLTKKKDKTYYPSLKICSLRDERFSYRVNSLATSTTPSTSAAVMSLANPYMCDDACVLDAFCGCGTFIIERNQYDGARDKYAVDIFGDAIKAAKDNAVKAGVDVNFITRDVLEFTSKHPFDEIYADMPMRGDRTKEELAALYDGFFAKAVSLSNANGCIFVLSNEKGLVMKNLRLQERMNLEREFLIRSKDEMSLYIIRIK